MTAQTDTPETETSSDGPLLDLTDAGVKKFIKQAKTRGYVTMEDLNKVLPSEEVTPDQIEDTLAMLSEMGVNVVEAEEDAEQKEGEGGEIAERADTSVAETPAKAAYDRTDDPVRMYLREMGSVELLSREGEIAIAKRIEAGRDAMISGLCESALTFEAIMVWRDELAANRILLREVIDLDATYAVLNPAAAPGRRRDRHRRRRGRAGRGEGRGGGRRGRRRLRRRRRPVDLRAGGRAARRRHGGSGRRGRRLRRLPQAAGQAGRGPSEGRHALAQGPEDL
jgi:Sigma-70 factor, region 1.